MSTAEAIKTGGLRERQKAKRYQAILDAARRLFPELGFQGTSMEAIAEQAEVGVATVYNYFGTKGGLLAAMQGPEFASLEQQGQVLLEAPPENPVRGVLKLIAIYRHFQDDWSSRQLLTAMIAPGLSAEPVLDELAEKAEAQLKQQLQDLMRAYQKSGVMDAGIDTRDAAMVVFCIFNQHFIDYVTHDDIAFENMSKDMDRQIELLIQGLL